MPLRLRVPTRVGCALRPALVDRVHDDVLPFTPCSGIEVRCVDDTLSISARCPKGEAASFRRLVQAAGRRPVLAGLAAEQIRSAEIEARAECDRRHQGQTDREICYRGIRFLVTRMKSKSPTLEGRASAFVDRWIEESKRGLPAKFKRAKIVRE